MQRDRTAWAPRWFRPSVVAALLALVLAAPVSAADNSIAAGVGREGAAEHAGAFSTWLVLNVGTEGAAEHAHLS